MPDNEPIITPSNDHDLLIRIDTRIMDMLRENREFKISLATKCDKEDIKLWQESVDKRLLDFENRTRKLEKTAAIAIGVISVVQVLIAIILK